jgi:hypothetical protein
MPKIEGATYWIKVKFIMYLNVNKVLRIELLMIIYLKYT